jgi:DNA-binding NtrC family response regulator
MSPLDVLIVEDDDLIRTCLEHALSEAGHRVSSCMDGALARARTLERPFDVVLADIRLPRLDGLSLFRHLREAQPSTDVILMTAYATVQDAVAALREGACDYLLKPISNAQLNEQMQRIAERRALTRALRLPQPAQTEAGVVPLIGSSPPMQKVLAQLESVAQSDAPVLITGESGTGKELVARALHERGPRRDKSLVSVNCPGFPDTLLEAELFGHERGAFTGAVRKRDGRFSAADGGTLFLDEIAEMSATAQPKLLRVLQEGTFEPLGTNTTRKVNVRVVSATNRNLRDRIAQGRFLEDLYYRLKVFEITLPPLRERRGDLPQLVAHFLRHHTPPGAAIPEISAKAWATLSGHSFPGNVRELAHAVEHAVVMSRGGTIEPHHLPFSGPSDPGPPQPKMDLVRPLSQVLSEFEGEYLRHVLKVTHGKRARTAELLGISRRSLWLKLRKHRITDPGS